MTTPRPDRALAVSDVDHGAHVVCGDAFVHGEPYKKTARCSLPVGHDGWHFAMTGDGADGAGTVEWSPDPEQSDGR